MLGFYTKIFISVACVVLFCIGFLILIIALMRAAAPQNEHERMRDDYEQMKALGYFKDTITSGCPVKDSPVE